ncbi:MAG: hypothetical protein HUU29_08540 [Planctomycetaceae bacterium]|nr:hypothetical protein [Planctomycetaceae bacterium]
MTLARFSFVKEPDLAHNGAAAVATIAHHYGQAATLESVQRKLQESNQGKGAISLLDVVNGAQALGFEASGVEGSYDEFMQVKLPAIAHLKMTEESAIYVVVHEINEKTITVADPGFGVVEMTREDFSALWSGYVVLVEPKPGTAPSAPSQQAGTTADPKKTSALIEKALFVLSVLGVAIALKTIFIGESINSGANNLIEQLAIAGIGLCAILSSWSYTFAKLCPSCTAAGKLVGNLPLGQIGHGLYATLFAIAFFRPDTALVPLAMFAALGAHAMLMSYLIRWKLRCITCILTASVAGITSGLLVAAYWPDVWPLLGAAPLAALAMWMTVRYAGRAAEASRVVATLQVINKVTGEGRRVPLGKALMVVFKRKGCAPCEFYAANVKPALEKTFGDSLIFDEHEETSGKLGTPTIIVLGAMPVLFSGLPQGNELNAAIKEAQRGIGKRLRENAGVRVMGHLVG